MAAGVGVVDPNEKAGLGVSPSALGVEELSTPNENASLLAGVSEGFAESDPNENVG